MAAVQFYLPYPIAAKPTNVGAPGASLYVYAPGTTTLRSVYADDSLTTQLSNPVVADGAGRFADIYLDNALTYKIVIEDKNGGPLFTRDPYIPGEAPDAAALQPYQDAAAASATAAAGYAASIAAAVSSGQSLVAASRGALALLATDRAVILMEAGREGTFVFDSSNLSTKVTADTAQGIYVAPAASTGLAIDGSQGAWVRHPGIDMSINTNWFGPDGVDDTAAIHAACAMGFVLGRKHIRIGSDPICTTSVTIDEAGLIINGEGVTLTSSVSTLTAAFRVSGAGVKIRGLTIHVTDTSTNLPYIEITAANVHFTNVFYQRDATANIPMYLRAGASGFQWRGGKFDAYGGINSIDASHVLLDGVVITQPDSFTGTDDAVAIKSITAAVTDWRVVNCWFRNKADFVGIGSEVGTSAANDSTYSKGVSGVVVESCYGDRCACIGLIKPGLQYDYRDGYVEDIKYIGCHLYDPTGVFARNLAFITAGRGSRVRRIHFIGCSATYRSLDRNGSGNAGILIQSLDFTGGTNTAEIDGVYVDQVSVTDPFGGVASGTAGTSGYPIDQFISIDGSTGVGGAVTIIKRVEVDNFRGNGCARMGMFVSTSASVTGPIVLRNPIFRNYSAAELASTDRAAIANAGGKVEVHGLVPTPAATANAATRLVMGDSGTASVDIVGENTEVFVGDIPSGTVTKYAYFSPDRPVWIRKIEGVVGNGGITQNDTNFLTIITRNVGVGIITTTNTKVTGGVSFAEGTLVTLGTAQYLGANAYIAKDGKVRFEITSTGTGQAAQQVTFRVHYVTCGAP